VSIYSESRTFGALDCRFGHGVEIFYRRLFVFQILLSIKPGLPDEFVEKSPKMLAKPFLSKLIHNLNLGKSGL
jgi:hypothetical protein